MFGLFKKKSATEVSKKEYAPRELPAPAPSKMLGFEDFQLLLKAYFRSDNSAGTYFAQCFGIQFDALDTASYGAFFIALITYQPEAVGREGKQQGYIWLEGAIMAILSSDNMDILLALECDEPRNPKLSRTEIDRLHFIAKRVRSKFTRKFNIHFSGFDLEQVAFDYVVALRNNEIEMMASALRDRTEHIKKIFGPLRNSRVNKYGDENYEPEQDEMDEFLKYAFSSEDFRFFHLAKPSSVLLDVVDLMFEGDRALEDMPVDGIEFEHWCADVIREQGWQVQVSKASGDQGVDVMAYRDGLPVAIQCKRYSKPIGNKAVQEVFAGAQYQDAEHCCVIGTGGFTASANQIAAKTGVHLLDASNIGMFSELFGFESLCAQSAEGTLDVAETVETLEAPVVFALSGLGGGLIGILLISAALFVDPEELGISTELCSAILSSLDENTGHGAFETDRVGATTLLGLAAFWLRNELPLSQDSAEVMKNSPYFDGGMIDALADTTMVMETILDHFTVVEADKLIVSMADDLGPNYASIIHQHVAEILENSIA